MEEVIWWIVIARNGDGHKDEMLQEESLGWGGKEELWEEEEKEGRIEYLAINSETLGAQTTAAWRRNTTHICRWIKDIVVRDEFFWHAGCRVLIIPTWVSRLGGTNELSTAKPRGTAQTSHAEPGRAQPFTTQHKRRISWNRMISPSTKHFYCVS